MWMGSGLAVTGLVIALALAGIASTGPAAAQEARDDTAARQYFEHGRSAFENADYERALVLFRHAYRLSERPELQYNIGVAADRLQREEEALEAFERYLADTDQPSREAEVKERIAALRVSIEERDATERALVDATVESRAVQTGSVLRDGSRLPKSAIVGGTALAAIGVAGVSAMAVGLARDGSCSERVGDACVAQHSTTAWTYVYGGLGLAALAGSATWVAVSAKRSKARERDLTWQLTPTGLRVSGKF